MKSTTSQYRSGIIAPSRSLSGRVEIGSTVYGSNGTLQSIKIESTPQMGKFFGYTMCHMLTFTIQGTDTHTINIGDTCQAYLGTDLYQMGYCYFYVDKIEVDKKTGARTITAYDKIYQASKMTVSDLNLTVGTSYTIQQLISLIGTALGVNADWNRIVNYNLSSVYGNTFNAPADMSLRDFMEDICEVTGAICYMADYNQLRFYGFNQTSVDLTINPTDIYEYSIDNTITLSGIASVNELGDTVQVGGTTGYNQILQSNVFLSNRIDSTVRLIITSVYNYILGTSIPYSLTWRGNPALEPGDLIKIVDRAGNNYLTHYRGETLEYNGGMQAKSNWDSVKSDNTALSPYATVAETAKTTKAVINKVTGEIQLITGDLDGIHSEIDQQADKIALVVTEQSGENVVNSASIVAGINNSESSVVISADHIDLSGTVTFHNLETSGETTINADNIITGTMSADHVQGGTLSGTAIDIGDGSFTVDNSGLVNAQQIVSMEQILVGQTVQIDNQGVNTSSVSADSVTTSSLYIGDVNVTNTTSGRTDTIQVGLIMDTASMLGQFRFHLIATTIGSSPAPYTFTSTQSVRFNNIKFRAIKVPYADFSVSAYFTFQAGSSLSNMATLSVYTSNHDFDTSTVRIQTAYVRYVGDTGFVVHSDLLPYTSATYDIGSANHKWSDIYATNSVIQTSDRRDKTDIQPLDAKYSNLFDKLHPVSYKWINGQSGRTHIGLIAQDVKDAMDDCDIDTQDFAGYIYNSDTDSYGLRYGEFISLLIQEVQTLKERVKVLEDGYNSTTNQ